MYYLKNLTGLSLSYWLMGISGTYKLEPGKEVPLHFARKLLSVFYSSRDVPRLGITIEGYSPVVDLPIHIVGVHRISLGQDVQAVLDVKVHLSSVVFSL